MDLHPAEPILGGIAIISGTLTIAAHYALPRRRWLFLSLKALTTSTILCLALVAAVSGWTPYAAAILLGLLFCLLGDVLLGLPHEQFLAGLASFMVANLIYAFAFAETSLPGASAWMALPLAVYGVFMVWYLWPGLSTRMRAPVSAYLLVMLVMTGLALHRATSRISFGTLAAAAGAFLYMASDSVLAIGRFRRPFHLSRAIVLGTYFIGQLLIATSVGN